MMAGLDTLLDAIDAAPAGVAFFLRDDDAGWDDAALFALLEVTGRAGVPIDLAVIPHACSAALAEALCARKDAAPDLIGVHQHGWTHFNHERIGRKCEFGASRNANEQRDDLYTGRERLRAAFGSRLDAMFTPPWNRCSADTPPLLAELGYSALSRSRGAAPQQSLPELPVDVDWCKQLRLAEKPGDDGGRRIAVELAARVAAGGPVGLMLHHAQMNAADLALLDELFRATRRNPQARWMPMRELIGGATPFPPDNELS